MAICRVEKVKNFTVMSNYHLDDIRLSLKAIGLLSKMLRLPDDWDFSIKGLTAICHDGNDSIASALKELEKLHYIKREQQRDNKGHVGKMIYYVYEVPYDIDRTELNKPEFTSKAKKSPQRENPVTVNPFTDNPDTDNPDAVIPETDKPSTEEPNRENPAQINTNTQTNTEELNTYELTPEKPITENNNSIFDNPSIYLDEPSEIKPMSRKDRLMDIKQKVRYELIQMGNERLDERLEDDDITLEEYDEKYVNLNVLDMIIDMMADVYQSNTSQVQIGNRSMPRNILIERFERLNYLDIKNIIKTVFEKRPKNRRLYTAMMIMNY